MVVAENMFQHLLDTMCPMTVTPKLVNRATPLSAKAATVKFHFCSAFGSCLSATPTRALVSLSNNALVSLELMTIVSVLSLM